MIISARYGSPHRHPDAYRMKVLLDGKPLPSGMYVIEFNSETKQARVMEQQPGADYVEREVNGDFTVWLDNIQVC